MTLVKYNRVHASLIIPQKRQEEDYRVSFTPEYAAELEAGEAYTGLDDDGRVMFCGGLLPQQGGMILWTILAEGSERYLTRMTRIGRRMVKQCKQTVVSTVSRDFAEAARWCKMVGLEFKEPCEKYGPMGAGMDAYWRKPS